MAYRFLTRGEFAQGIARREKIEDVALVTPGNTQSARLTPQLAAQIEMPFVENAFVLTLSSDVVDRYNDVIHVKGWELGNFIKAGGPLLFGHNSDHVIGNIAALWKRDGLKAGKNKLRGVAAFSRETDLGRETLALVDGGQIRAGSVGFRPLEYDFRLDEEGWIIGYDFFKQDLVEHSITPTPANPDALIGKSAQYPHFLRAVEERIELKLGDDLMRKAYCVIKGTRIQEDTVGLGSVVKELEDAPDADEELEIEDDDGEGVDITLEDTPPADPPAEDESSDQDEGDNAAGNSDDAAGEDDSDDTGDSDDAGGSETKVAKVTWDSTLAQIADIDGRLKALETKSTPEGEDNEGDDEPFLFIVD